MGRYLSILTAGLVIGTAAAALGQQSKTSHEDRQLFEQLGKDYEAAYNRQDAAGIAALYSDDAVEMRPQGIQEGRVALEKEYQGQFQAGCRDLALSIKDYRTSGDIGWAIGGWTAKCGGNPLHGLWSNVTVRDGGKLRIQQNSVIFAAEPVQGGSSSSAATNGKGCTKIGVLLPETATSARWDAQDRPALIADIEAAIPGATVDSANAQGDAATQQNQADQALARGDCILVVAPSDSTAAAAIVTKAKASNVPVIAYDRIIQSKDLSYYVSFDEARVGILQGQYIVDHYKSFTKNSKNVVLINGSQTDQNALNLHKGVEETLAPLFANGTLKKVYDQFTPNWDNPTAQTEMEGALTANNNNIAIAYVANDGMASAVIAELRVRHLNGNVLVTGQDATVAGLQNILKGDQSMTVYKPINREAQATADIVKALNAGTTPTNLTGKSATVDGGSIPSVMLVPIAIDKTNIASTVIADGSVTKAAICAGIPAGTGGVC